MRKKYPIYRKYKDDFYNKAKHWNFGWLNKNSWQVWKRYHTNKDRDRALKAIIGKSDREDPNLKYFEFSDEVEDDKTDEQDTEGEDEICISNHMPQIC